MKGAPLCSPTPITPLLLPQVQLGVLFAMYAAPNTFMPVTVAILASSQRSLWRLVLGLVSLVCLGGCVAYAGVALEMYALVLAGRLIFGFSSESLYGRWCWARGAPSLCELWL